MFHIAAKGKPSSLRAMAGKAGAIAALSIAAIGFVAPNASADNEPDWDHGCRGYWYGTSGHAYCKDATATGKYRVTYNCQAEHDYSATETLRKGYTGKWNAFECTFDMTHSDVNFLD